MRGETTRTGAGVRADPELRAQAESFLSMPSGLKSQAYHGRGWEDARALYCAESEGEAAEARHDAEGAMAERNATQGELDDIADLLGIAKDPPHGAVRDAIKRQRDALATALDAMVKGPNNGTLYRQAIAEIGRALGADE